MQHMLVQASMLKLTYLSQSRDVALLPTPCYLVDACLEGSKLSIL